MLVGRTRCETPTSAQSVNSNRIRMMRSAAGASSTLRRQEMLYCTWPWRAGGVASNVARGTRHAARKYWQQHAVNTPHL